LLQNGMLHFVFWPFPLFTCCYGLNSYNTIMLWNYQAPRWLISGKSIF